MLKRGEVIDLKKMNILQRKLYDVMEWQIQIKTSKLTA